jgi:glycerol uptake facilitator-like aquaporin
MAEATRAFFYVFPGIASVASFTLNGTSHPGSTAFGSLFEIGWAFAIGIAFAIITCGLTSGGHLNSAITICFAIWQGFSWKKSPPLHLQPDLRRFYGRPFSDGNVVA